MPATGPRKPVKPDPRDAGSTQQRHPPIPSIPDESFCNDSLNNCGQKTHKMGHLTNVSLSTRNVGFHCGRNSRTTWYRMQTIATSLVPTSPVSGMRHELPKLAASVTTSPPTRWKSSVGTEGRGCGEGPETTKRRDADTHAFPRLLHKRLSHSEHGEDKTEGVEEGKGASCFFKTS